MLRRGGRDRRVGQPQQLVRRRDRGVGGDGSPARGHAAGRYKPRMDADPRIGARGDPRGRVGRADGRARARLRAGQPGRAAAGGRVRLPALLRRQPAPVPGARGRRPGLVRAQRRPPRAPICAPISRATASTATASSSTSSPRSRDVWREDLVAFLIGCSFTFERALLAAGLPVRHIEQGVNVPMYTTAVACRPAGRFAGPLVVSMRPMTPRAGDPRDRDHEPLHDRARPAGAHRRPRRRSGSPSSRARSTATRSRSATARSRCSGPAASRRRRSPPRAAPS